VETIIVERKFESPATFERLQVAEDAIAWCLTLHNVRFLRSYLSLDGLSMLCVYEAPDAQAVREAQRRGGLPFERAWPALPMTTSPSPHAVQGRSTVVVERELVEPYSLEQLAQGWDAASSCFALHQAAHLTSYLRNDGTRLICIFDALDTDSLRMANRLIGVPVTRLWPATYHAPG